MRRAARTDANHAAIVAALRGIGASVASTAAVGNGFPDIVVGFRGRNWLIECKDGSKPPSDRKLTPAQQDFRIGWRGHWIVVESPDEAVREVTRC